jgi:hypothetical protein
VPSFRGATIFRPARPPRRRLVGVRRSSAIGFRMDEVEPVISIEPGIPVWRKNIDAL